MGKSDFHISPDSKNESGQRETITLSNSSLVCTFQLPLPKICLVVSNIEDWNKNSREISENSENICQGSLNNQEMKLDSPNSEQTSKNAEQSKSKPLLETFVEVDLLQQPTGNQFEEINQAFILLEQHPQIFERLLEFSKDNIFAYLFLNLKWTRFSLNSESFHLNTCEKKKIDHGSIIKRMVMNLQIIVKSQFSLMEVLELITGLTPKILTVQDFLLDSGRIFSSSVSQSSRLDELFGMMSLELSQGSQVFYSRKIEKNKVFSLVKKPKMLPHHSNLPNSFLKVMSCMELSDGSKWVQIQSNGIINQLTQDLIDLLAFCEQELVHKINHSIKHDNPSCWISFEEFIKASQDLLTIKLNHKLQWNSLTLNSPDESSLDNFKISIVKIRIWKTGQYFFSITQEKGVGSDQLNQLDFTLASVIDLKESTSRITQNVIGCKKQLELSSVMEEGDYIALVKQTKHHQSALSQLNFCCNGDASVSLAYLKTEFNEDIENYYDIINLSIWTTLINKSSSNLQLLREEKTIACPSLDSGSKELSVQCSTTYIEDKQIYILQFKNPQNKPLRFFVKLKFPETHFIFLGFERVEKEGILVTEVVNPKEEAVFMLKNLSHYDTISETLREDFEIEVEGVHYKHMDKGEKKPEINFLQLILDLISSSELYPEKTILETLSIEQQEELITSDGQILIPLESTQQMLSHLKMALSQLEAKINRSVMENEEFSAASILTHHLNCIEYIFGFKKLYSLSTNTDFKHIFLDLTTLLQLISNRIQNQYITKAVEELEKKIRRFFVQSSIGSQYKLATIKEKVEFLNLEMTTMDSSKKENQVNDQARREDNIKIVESPQILDSGSKKVSLSLSQIINSLGKKEKSASKAQSMPQTPVEVLQQKKVNSDPIPASKQLELGQTDVSCFIFDSKLDENTLRSSENSKSAFKEQIQQVEKIKEPEKIDENLIDLVRDEIEQFEFVNRQIEESLTLPENLRKSTLDEAALADIQNQQNLEREHFVTPRTSSRSPIKQSSHTRSKSQNPAQISTEECDGSLQMMGSKIDKDISRLYNYSASDQKRSKKSQMQEENQDPINNRASKYYGLNSQLFDSTKKNSKNLAPNSLDFYENSQKSPQEQNASKKNLVNTGFGEKSAEKNRFLIPQLQKMLHNNEIFKQKRQHSESGKKSKLKKILEKMNSTKNLATGKESILVDRDQEEDRILEKIVQKYQSIEANSRENSTEKSSFVMLQSEQTQKDRRFDSAKIKHCSLNSQFDEYDASDQKKLQKLLSRVGPDLKNPQVELPDKISAEDSSNLSITKDDTYRVVSETTTKVRSKDDFELRSGIDRSLLNGNISEHQGRKYPYHFKHQLTADSAISSIPTSVKSRYQTNSHNRVNSEVKLALPINKWEEKSNKKKSGSKKVKLEKKVKKQLPQQSDLKFKKIKDSIEYEKERRSSGSHSKKVRFSNIGKNQEDILLRNKQRDQRLSFFNNTNAVSVERQTPTFVSNINNGAPYFYSQALPSARQLLFKAKNSSSWNPGLMKQKIVIDSNPMTDKERVDSVRRRERRYAVKTRSLSKLGSIIHPQSISYKTKDQAYQETAPNHTHNQIQATASTQNFSTQPTIKHAQHFTRASEMSLNPYPNSARVFSRLAEPTQSSNILSLIRKPMNEDPYSSRMIGESKSRYQPSFQTNHLGNIETSRRIHRDNSQASVLMDYRVMSVRGTSLTSQEIKNTDGCTPDSRQAIVFQPEYLQKNTPILQNTSCYSRRSYICSVSSDSRGGSQEKICIVGNQRPITNLYNSRHSSRSKTPRPINKSPILIEEYSGSGARYSSCVVSNIPMRIQQAQQISSNYHHSLSGLRHTRINSVEVQDRNSSYTRSSILDSSLLNSRIHSTIPSNQMDLPAVIKGQALKLKNSKFFKS